MTTKQKVIDVQNLKVDIDVPAGTLHAVSGISFHVNQGETLCIVGESGCGKSITALALMNLLPKKAKLTADKLELQGRNLMAMSEGEFAKLRGDRMSMIFQDPMTSLNPVYRVGDQMEEVYMSHGKGGRKEAHERAEFLLDKVGITAAKSRLIQYPHQLSGGLRQRVVIAMSLMCEPDLLIADEPTTALDVTIQAQILQLLADIQKASGVGLILITHDIGVVASIADDIAVMYRGQIVEYGPAQALLAAPLHPYTEGLLQSIPIPGRVARGQPLGYIPGIVPPPIETPKSCVFAPRCPYVSAACRAAPVALRRVGETHAMRCILPPDPSTRNAEVWTRAQAETPR